MRFYISQIYILHQASCGAQILQRENIALSNPTYVGNAIRHFPISLCTTIISAANQSNVDHDENFNHWHHLHTMPLNPNMIPKF